MGTSAAVVATHSVPPPAAAAVADLPETRPLPRLRPLAAVAAPAAVVAVVPLAAAVLPLVARQQLAAADSLPLPLPPIAPIVQIHRFVDVDTLAVLPLFPPKRRMLCLKPILL